MVKIYIIQGHDDSSPQTIKICKTLEAAEREREKMIREDYDDFKRMWPVTTHEYPANRGKSFTWEEYREAVSNIQHKYGMKMFDDDRFSVYINTYDIVEQELTE